MQLTMKKMGAVVVAAALALCIAPVVTMLTPGQAHAAGKINIAGADSNVSVNITEYKYSVKTGADINLTAYKGGKQVKPKVEVVLYQPGTYDAEGNYTEGKTVKLKKNTDYTITYKNNKNVGWGYVIVKGKGKYTGTVIEGFSIEPAKTKVTKVKGAKKALTVS